MGLVQPAEILREPRELAGVLPVQGRDGVRARLQDPAGHPFCLTAAYAWG